MSLQKNLKITLVLVLAGAGSLPALADLPLTRGTAARPLALGAAYVALADDASALFINTAGLARIKDLKFISTYNQPIDNAAFTALGAALPNRFGGTVGLGYRNRTISNIQVSTEAADATDQEFLLAYSRQLSDAVALGGALRLASSGYSKSVAGFPTSSGRALDLSLKYDYLPWWSWGLALQNLAGQIVYSDGTVTDLNYIIKLGSSVAFRQAKINLDLVKEEDERITSHLGLEWWLLKPLALRAGLDQAEVYTNTTVGLGLRLSGVTIDYAWYRQGDPSQAVTHYFSLGYVGPEEKKMIRAKGPSYPSPEPKPAVATRLKRSLFSDLADKDPAKETIELLATAGLIYGYPDGTFKPDVKLSRSHFSALLLAAKNLQSSTPAKDVGGVLWAKQPEKLVSRGEAATFMGVSFEPSDPERPITRREFVIFLAKTERGKAALKRLPPLLD